MREDLWLERLRAGDSESFRELVERYQHRVFAMSYRFTGCSHEAKDLAQDIFLRIYENIDGFRGASSLDSWVYRLSLNYCISWRRRQKRRAVLGRDGPVYGIEAGEPPDERLAAAEENERLHRMLRKLPDRYMTVIELYYYQELSYQQIADMTGVAVRTVETRLYRARSRLKELLVPEKGGKEEHHGRYENAAAR